MNFAVTHGGSHLESTKLFAMTTGRCRLGMFCYITATQLLPPQKFRHCNCRSGLGLLKLHQYLHKL